MTEKLKIFKDKEDKYHFKTKDDRHVDIEHKDRRLKFKLHKWDREVSVEVFLDMVEADTHKFSGNKIEVEDSKKKIRVYPIDTRSTTDFYGDTTDDIQCHDGGLRYDIKYFEKPPTNFYDESLVCKNTRWAKQPFLTQEDIDRGRSCPINVEGSYAIYHVSKKNNEYMTGKFGQRYRPIAIDALGNMAWCDMEVDRPIDPSNMRVTIPQQFLDEATYPIVVDPDFGYTAIGANATYIAEKDEKGDPFEARKGCAWEFTAANSTANYLRARLLGSEPCDVKAFINQKDSGGAGTHAQIATKENLQCITAGHWEQFDLAGENLTQGVDYILSVIGNEDDMHEAMDSYRVNYDYNGATSLETYLDPHDDYDAPASPWVENPYVSDLDISIYVNYPYVPPGWQGKISGITNPAKIMGIPVAGIVKVKGIPA